ncbi:type IV secretory system conjugative DNA transfer family protein [Streptomyces sp. NRRL WC-3626]|uniref:type IV secretory system conjugative DNA transfer family protein n=1 Tax=Streptomyces sp. NRRL WC-3626 TaxID=1463926 RepID=UPI0004C1476C|nr:type IV secretory system conjugative DNA transfer family protein [Streptomyces sp. NRRL WC-3626]
MRPDDRREQGGIPDGLLVGILAFLLGMTAMVWTATGLAGLFAHGHWPDGITFTRTPLAIRHLVAEPDNLPGAWPDTPESALSGYGLFWGLFIGQLMILTVLAVFVMGTLARWRALRSRRRTDRKPAVRQRQPEPEPLPEPEPKQLHEVPTPREPEKQTPVPEEPVRTPVADGEPVAGWETPRVEGAGLHNGPPATAGLCYGPPATRHTAATQAVRDAEGPALVLTSNPTLWHDTKDARAKLGPTHLYDPTHLCDTPARLHWSPTAGCEDKDTAKARAVALLSPVRPTSRLDQAVADTAETLLRSYVHAAAVDGRTIRHVHRWSQGIQVHDAVRILRTSPKAAPGSAGELEAALTAHPERRDMAQQLTTRALAALSTVNVREACTPNRTDALALDSFIHEGGTLYVVGESIEDPRTSPGAMPLLTALTSHVVEHGRRMAARSSSGRLDPPLTLVLDDVAAVAPLPQLPDLLATGTDLGLPTLALLRSREQARARWPHTELPV